MINLRKCLPNDELFVLANRIDQYLGDKDFYEVPNDVLEVEKNKMKEIIKANYDDYKIIINDQEAVGSFAAYKFEDGTLLDSLALINGYNRNDIKEFVIKYVISSNYGYIYSYIYKHNKNDLELFKSLGFSIIAEDNEKYKLRLNNL